MEKNLYPRTWTIRSLSWKIQLKDRKKAVETVKNKSNEISNLASSLQTLIVRGINSLDDETVQSVLLSANARKISEKGVQMIQICGEKIAIDQQTSLHAIASCLYNESKKTDKGYSCHRVSYCKRAEKN